jgi:asparagine synthase (glutamine-hydrolysing)
MCGLAGFLSPANALYPEELTAVLTSMGASLLHRGPDDSGIWFDADAGIGISHRRLSILDLSLNGGQPMVSASGRFVIAFNGEIYNHLEIRSNLGTFESRGHSDTETLLNGFDVWGIEKTLRHTVGMFAIAVWDLEDRVLTLARDRMGEKPLYYGWQSGVFLFGSELKALRRHPAFRGEIDRRALELFMRYGYVPSPYSIFRDIQKLEPGTLLRVQASDKQLQQPLKFWALKDIAEVGQSDPFKGTDEEAVALLDFKLRDSVRLQQIADVPLGAFLSGGIDSTTIVALMQSISSRPVRTFTIGFEEDSYNEAEYARLVARHLGTDHTEFYATAKDAQAVIPRLGLLYDEPFADSSQIPTFIVSELAKRHVKVSLSGDAGDELFGGYNRYTWMMQILRSPKLLRKIIGMGILTFRPSTWNKLYALVSPILLDSWRISQPGDKAHKLAAVLGADTPESIYRSLVTAWAPSSGVVLNLTEFDLMQNEYTWHARFAEFEHSMMAEDSLTYLPNDILVKLDRAAMGVSLETRAPFLDHRVVEFAWQLPLEMKVRDGQGKWLLRQLLARYVPKELFERPKMGFGVPIDSWLRGPLRDWAEALLDESRLRKEGFLNPAPIREKWREHLSRERNWQQHLWHVLMFQTWLETQSETTP